MSALAPTLQAFFTDRLMSQRGASPNTISGYRDTFRLLLRFASERAKKNPATSISPTWTPRSSPRSWRTSSRYATTAPAPGTTGWRLCVRSSVRGVASP